MRFYAAPEYQVFPTRERPLKPYEAVVRAVGETAPAHRATSRPDVVVNDVLTLAPALAAELEGVPLRDARAALLSPHRRRACRPTGSARCRAAHALGRALWRALARPTARRRRARAPGAERDAPPRRAAGARAALRRDQPRTSASSAPSRSSSTRAAWPRAASTSPGR